MENVEKEITLLKKRISSLESGSGYEAKKELLNQLREIRYDLGADKSKAICVQQERDQLAKQNEELKTKVTKLEYRIKHLLRALEEAEKKNQ